MKQKLLPLLFLSLALPCFLLQTIKPAAKSARSAAARRAAPSPTAQPRDTDGPDDKSGQIASVMASLKNAQNALQQYMQKYQSQSKLNADQKDEIAKGYETRATKVKTLSTRLSSLGGGVVATPPPASAFIGGLQGKFVPPAVFNAPLIKKANDTLLQIRKTLSRKTILPDQLNSMYKTKVNSAIDKIKKLGGTPAVRWEDFVTDQAKLAPQAAEKQKKKAEETKRLLEGGTVAPDAVDKVKQGYALYRKRAIAFVPAMAGQIPDVTQLKVKVQDLSTRLVSLHQKILSQIKVLTSLNTVLTGGVTAEEEQRETDKFKDTAAKAQKDNDTLTGLLQKADPKKSPRGVKAEKIPSMARPKRTDAKAAAAKYLKQIASIDAILTSPAKLRARALVEGNIRSTETTRMKLVTRRQQYVDQIHQLERDASKGGTAVTITIPPMPVKAHANTLVGDAENDATVAKKKEAKKKKDDDDDDDDEADHKGKTEGAKSSGAATASSSSAGSGSSAGSSSSDGDDSHAASPAPKGAGGVSISGSGDAAVMTVEKKSLFGGTSSTQYIKGANGEWIDPKTGKPLQKDTDGGGGQPGTLSTLMGAGMGGAGMGMATPGMGGYGMGMPGYGMPMPGYGMPAAAPTGGVTINMGAAAGVAAVGAAAVAAGALASDGSGAVNGSSSARPGVGDFVNLTNKAKDLDSFDTSSMATPYDGLFATTGLSATDTTAQHALSDAVMAAWTAPLPGTSPTGG